MNITRSFAIAASLACLLSSVLAQTTVVNDSFTSAEDRATGALATDRANWFVLQNSSSAPMSPAGGSSGTAFSVTTAGAGTSANAYMARWTPTTLSVGDTLTVSLTVAFSRLPATTASFRYGIFDSTPAGVIAGDVTSANQTSFIGDTGYAWTANSSFNVGPGATAANTVFRLGERTTLTGGNVFSAGADFTPFDVSSGANAAWAINTDYTLTMSFYLSAADALVIDASLAGGLFGSGIASPQFVDSTPSATTFDYFLLRASTGNAQDLVFKNLTVTLASAPIPEPSTYAALFGAAALGLVFWRRRARLARD